MAKEFFSKLTQEIEKNGKSKVDENGNNVVEISFPKLILSSINAMDKKDLQNAMKNKRQFDAVRINKPVE